MQHPTLEHAWHDVAIPGRRQPAARLAPSGEAIVCLGPWRNESLDGPGVDLCPAALPVSIGIFPQNGFGPLAMKFLGLCRFSLLGRGDWRIYRGQPDDGLEEVYLRQSAILFSPERMDQRFATFEHVTLASLRAQTDQDFLFLVAASDRMPQIYRERLTSLCAGLEQAVLRFRPPCSIADVQIEVMQELGLTMEEVVQFRMDDDDGVSRHFISQARRHASTLNAHPAFAISFAQHYFCAPDGQQKGIYEWFCPFLGAGLCVRHPRRSIFGFGHFQLPARMVALTDARFPNVVTHLGGNDTAQPAGHPVNLRGRSPASPARIAADLQDHFRYLDDRGRSVCGFEVVA